MGHSIIVTPEARGHLDDIYDYIAAAASPEIARRFTDGILHHIGKLTDFPNRGTMRDDLRPGLRTIAWRRRVTIAFAVDDKAVVVVGVFYGGRDFETLLDEDS
ncbi:type II toxin-antitoxin system RelE/ParE family toxin [Rhizorhabdus wittichii]|uniref:Type II toxin-antitoxin system RelE/ParE family toxin n=1 Tax=Rhizorhabdus wittichii TaxID=160791 RepID=A0A975D3Z6_9SPHN|nr:type II toxin-antitoxin system RelE/ParE family toxin [Rhizorhabdus wittichii]QTH22472.1 type II toxin-antitoxin system RelE/ParE family toxin [Rhizorhabdus wittichii]